MWRRRRARVGMRWRLMVERLSFLEVGGRVVFLALWLRLPLLATV